MANVLTLQEYADYIELSVDSMTAGYLIRKSFTSSISYADTIYEETGSNTLTFDDRSCLQGHTYTYWITQGDGSTIVSGPLTGQLKQYKLIGRGGGARGGRRRKKDFTYNIECELCGFKAPRNVFRKGYVRPHVTGINYLPNAAAPENWTWTLTPEYFDSNVWNWFIQEETNPEFSFPQIEKDSDLRTPPGHHRYPGIPLLSFDNEPGINLLANGGFQIPGAGGADIWASWTEVPGSGTISNETTFVYEGSSAAKIVRGIPADHYIHQSVSVTAGVGYLLRFQSASSHYLAPARYSIYDVDNAVYIVEKANATITSYPPHAPYEEYNQTDYYFKAPAGCTTIRIELWCEDTVYLATVYFDKIELRQSSYTIPVGDNAVRNPGFETLAGPPPLLFLNWLTSARNGAIAVENVFVKSGSNAVKMTYIGPGPDYNGPLVRQSSIPCEPNTFYLLSFWDTMNDTIGANPYSVEYAVDGFTDFLGENLVPMTSTGHQGASYLNEVALFSTKDDMIRLTLYFYVNKPFATGEYFLDDVSITKVYSNTFTIGTPTTLGTGTLILWVYPLDIVDDPVVEIEQNSITLASVELENLPRGWHKILIPCTWSAGDAVIAKTVKRRNRSVVLFGGAQLTTSTGDHAAIACLPHRSSGLGNYTTGGMMSLCPACYSGLRKRVPWE